MEYKAKNHSQDFFQIYHLSRKVLLVLFFVIVTSLSHFGCNSRPKECNIKLWLNGIQQKQGTIAIDHNRYWMNEWRPLPNRLHCNSTTKNAIGRILKSGLLQKSKKKWIKKPRAYDDNWVSLAACFRFTSSRVYNQACIKVPQEAASEWTSAESIRKTSRINNHTFKIKYTPKTGIQSTESTK